MRLKDKNSSPHGGFFFEIENEHGKIVRVPEAGKSANGIPQLEALAREALSKMGVAAPPDLAGVIEHQICMRQPNPERACWSGGIGDDLHHKILKPFFKGVQKAAARVKLKGLAKTAGKVAGCSTCGGGKPFKKGDDGTGRAGKLNRTVAKFIKNSQSNQNG